MSRPSPERRPRGREDVTGRDYDALREDIPPPEGVAGVTIEPMDAAGVRLLAGELLEVLEWARWRREETHE
ncbi:MAG TPA: hypothetical protein VMP42_05575 [Actinomycetota bacterium]|nr:hypothetical protein [Actinomycetota bacterium]